MTVEQRDALIDNHSGRFRDVANGVFGLIVVLSAFAITDLPLKEPVQLADDVCYFALTFLLVMSLWVQFSELLDLHDSSDSRIVGVLTPVLFFGTLVPVALKLYDTAPPAVAILAYYSFPVLMALTFGALALAAHRLVRFRRQRPHHHLAHLRMVRMRNLVTSMLLLTTLAVPHDLKLFGVVSVAGMCWVMTLTMVTSMVRMLMTRRQRPAVLHASMTALSKQSPTEPLDGSSPESSARRVKARM